MKKLLFLTAIILGMLNAGCRQPGITVEQDNDRESPASSAEKGAVLSELPELLNPSAHYLIYLHGAIVEAQGMHAVSPKFGPYEYAEILQTFADRGFIVISEARTLNTNPNVFAHHVAEQVRHLLDGGVPEEHITVMGFSKGGAIALLASGELPHDRINWIVEASCGPWITKLPDLVPHGRILSIYDSADDIVSSCGDLFKRMKETSMTREIVLDVGKGHGTFYTPDPAWVEKAVEWGGL